MDSLGTQPKTDTAFAKHGLSGLQPDFRYSFLLCFLAILHPNRVSAEIHWSWQNRVPQGDTLLGVAVLDPETAVAVGYAETVLRTNDGGDLWSVSARGPPADSPRRRFIWRRNRRDCCRGNGALGLSGKLNNTPHDGWRPQLVI
jgi:hypothetical protein